MFGIITIQTRDAITIIYCSTELSGSTTPVAPSSGTPCQSGEHRCGSGACVPAVRLCDGHRDCNDGSDEDRHANCSGANCDNCHQSHAGDIDVSVILNYVYRMLMSLMQNISASLSFLFRWFESVPVKCYRIITVKLRLNSIQIQHKTCF